MFLPKFNVGLAYYVLLLHSVTSAHDKLYPLSTHILDTSLGIPAKGVEVHLYKDMGDTWEKISKQITNDDGRIGNMIEWEQFTKGVYMLRFETGAYYKAQDKATFYPNVDVYFQIIEPGQHYHVPLLLNPYGYSTYRGS